MSEGRELYCYDYVNQPYVAVSHTLRAHPREVFSRATTVATRRAQTLASSLRVELGGMEVGAEVDVLVSAIEVHDAAPLHPPRTVIRLTWSAARLPALFPSMNAELVITPLTPTETQLELHGQYRPPFGALGTAIDMIVGHKVAAASVQSFVAAVAAHLRAQSEPAVQTRGASEG